MYSMETGLLQSQSDDKSCIICYNNKNTTFRIFPCGCSNPIHDECILVFKMNVGTCNTCHASWTSKDIHESHLNRTPVYSYNCWTGTKLMLCVTVFVIIKNNGKQLRSLVRRRKKRRHNGRSDGCPVSKYTTATKT